MVLKREYELPAGQESGHQGRDSPSKGVEGAYLRALKKQPAGVVLSTLGEGRWASRPPTPG